MSTSEGTAPPKRRIETIDLDDLRMRVMDMSDRHADPNNNWNIAQTDEDSQYRRDLFTLLDWIEKGHARAAYYENGVTYVDPSVIAAINLLFPLSEMQVMEAGAVVWHDKIELCTDHSKTGRRAVPGSFMRRWCFVDPKCVLMPSFVNLGAYVDRDSMVDTWATVGSSGQIGKKVHLSGGVGIGGVLEPPGAVPVIICDHAMIGSRAQIVEGALVEEGAVVAMGTSFSGNTRVFDRNLNELTRGVVPAWSTVKPFNGVSIPRDEVSWEPIWEDVPVGPDGNFWPKLVHGVQVVEQRKPGERPDKASLNELLRGDAIIG